jgi:hypothetical protein
MSPRHSRVSPGLYTGSTSVRRRTDTAKSKRHVGDRISPEQEPSLRSRIAQVGLLDATTRETEMALGAMAMMIGRSGTPRRLPAPQHFPRPV